MIEQAIHAEPDALVRAFSGERLEDGRARLLRHGHSPERDVMTGTGPVPVKVPPVRDRGPGDDRITFTPSILPRYLRKTKSVEELLPWLYLKGVSTGDFTQAPEALLGPNAKGLSARTITRLKADWWKDCETWQKRDLNARRFLCIRADRLCFKPRTAGERQCVLVIIGADEYGHKELLAMTDGFRESTESWRQVLLDLKRRDMKQDPELAIGDGALGFWTALREVFSTTQEQRCRVHKTMNVLNALPKSPQSRAKAHLHDIWQAETRVEAEAAFDFFVETCGVKRDKAVAKLAKDRDALPTFHDHPAERAQAPANTYARQTRSRAHSRPSATARNARRDVSAARPDWPWHSGRRCPHGKSGESSTVKTDCQRSSGGLSSATGSVNFKPPPDQAPPTSALFSTKSL